MKRKSWAQQNLERMWQMEGQQAQLRGLVHVSYRCPVCGRTTSLPSGYYTCKICKVNLIGIIEQIEEESK